MIEADTAGAARHLRELGDRTARRDRLEPRRRDLRPRRSPRADIEDAEHNTTRFVVLAAKPERTRKRATGPVITSFVFRVRNVPAALYKALGGFATNGVNMTKLESYQLEGSFNATMFYADIEGHPDERPVQLAMEELHFFSSEVTVLGTYPASPFRAELKASRTDADPAAWRRSIVSTMVSTTIIYWHEWSRSTSPSRVRVVLSTEPRRPEMNRIILALARRHDPLPHRPRHRAEKPELLRWSAHSSAMAR